MDRTKLFVRSFIALATVCGCAAGGADDAADLEAPQVLAVSATEVSVGDNLEIIGGNFVKSVERHTELELIGEYHTDGGAVHPVEMRFRPHWEDGNRLTWAYFGPFDVPFSPTGDELGTFVGELSAINVEAESGYEAYSEPLEIELTVGPSIIITELQPVEAQCSNRPNVLLGGFDYRVAVEAIGFDPVNFSFVIAGEPSSEAPRIYRQAAVGRAADFGWEGQLSFERVPGNLPFYLATLGIASLDTKNKQHILSLDFGVHNPVEYVNRNQVKVAELEAATPVSGCIAGGETNGRTVTYTESETETRSRTVGVNWNQEWYEEHSQSNGGSTSTTNSIDVEVSESTTTGAEWGWEDGRDISGGGNAGGSLFGVVEVGVSGEYKDVHREHASWNRSNTRGYTIGRNYSRTDTETWAFSRTAGYSLSTGGSDFWTVSSENSTIVSFEGFILPGEYGVFYRQTTRMALPGAIVAYNMCGEPEVVAETNFYDYTWSVDLAQGLECPPLPESSLPEAQCLMSPCDG